LGENLKKLAGIKRMALLIIVISTVAACGKSTTVVTDGGKLSADGKSVTMESKDENGKKTTAEFSSNANIPEEFPKDIPIPKGAKIKGSVKNADGNNQAIILTYTVDMEIEELSKLYADYIKENGYTDIMDMSNGDVIFISGNLVDSTLLINASKADPSAATLTGLITWTKTAN
jgi:hypothetical protein